jgi:hypothetical protein
MRFLNRCFRFKNQEKQEKRGNMRRCQSKVAVCLLALLAGGHLLPCQAVEAQKKSRRLWWASVAMVVAAGALDVASSRGGAEANPLLRGSNGTFNTGRAVLLKSLVTGGMVATEALVMRHSPGSGHSAAIVNFATSGTIGALAVHNWKVAAESK